jgi:hypothetical protein
MHARRNNTRTRINIYCKCALSYVCRLKRMPTLGGVIAGYRVLTFINVRIHLYLQTSLYNINA